MWAHIQKLIFILWPFVLTGGHFVVGSGDSVMPLEGRGRAGLLSLGGDPVAGRGSSRRGTPVWPGRVSEGGGRGAQRGLSRRGLLEDGGLRLAAVGGLVQRGVAEKRKKGEVEIPGKSGTVT